ncbi:MAG TPA: ATP-binding cassette domain-containing protein [Methylomirabilota bacterium]|nr:ATP-binding cassette domain-containing protein [Methylomirabilota bacterium]
MQPLIQLHEVTVELGGRPVLHRLNWELRPGEHWAVIGGNGAGKSTFLRLVRGELWPAPDGIGRRLYALDGPPQITAVGVADRIALVSPELQDRYRQRDWRLTVAQVIASGLSASDYPARRLSAAQHRRVGGVARQLGLESLLPRNVQELSTGELRRVLIARALIGDPMVMVCDEICDGLDAGGRKALLAALDRLAGTRTQLLFTTHRPDELGRALTHAMVLDSGRIVAQGPRAALARRFLNPPSRARSPARGAVPLGDLPLACDRMAGRQPTAAGPGRAEKSGTILIRAERASVYLEGRPVLRRIDWQWRAGEHWAVLGPNGAGKSTFLKLIAGDLHPAVGGRVVRFDLTPRDTLWELRRRVGCISPEFQSAYRERLTAEQVVMSGFFASVGLLHRPARWQRERARELLASFGLAHLAERNALDLSYGEFRRVLLARALVHEPAVLICDEPFDGLDAAARTAMRERLEQLAAQGTGLLMVTHHLPDLPVCINRELHLRAGRIHAIRRR